VHTVFLKIIPDPLVSANFSYILAQLFLDG